MPPIKSEKNNKTKSVIKPRKNHFNLATAGEKNSNWKKNPFGVKWALLRQKFALNSVKLLANGYKKMVILV